MADNRAPVRGETRAVFLELFARHGIEVAGSEATLLPVGRRCPAGARRSTWAFDLLDRAGVVVAPGSFFGPEGEGYVRMAMVPTLGGLRAGGRGRSTTCSRRWRREPTTCRADRGLVGRRRPPTAPLDAEAVEAAIEMLDRGEVRVAEPDGDGWRVNAWAKQAVLLYFRVRGLETTEAGPFEYHDKLPLKRGYEALGVRVVPAGHRPLRRAPGARASS